MRQGLFLWELVPQGCSVNTVPDISVMWDGSACMWMILFCRSCRIVRILTITNNGASTLAKISDYNIVYHVPEVTVNATNITTSLPVIYILEDLAMRFHNDRMEKLKKEETCRSEEKE